MHKEHAREIAGIIRNHTELWDQSSWIGTEFGGTLDVGEVRRMLEDIKRDLDPATSLCGTTGCVAGWAGMLYSPPGTTIVQNGTILRMPDGFAFQGEGTVDIEFFARNILELNYDQADWLFGSDRSKDQVLWALENPNPDWAFDACPFVATDDYDNYVDYDDYDNDNEDDDL